MIVPNSVKRALAAKGNRETDFQRLKAALHHQEPDCVPLFEMGIEPEIKQQVMGRSINGYAEDIEFFQTVGLDVYPVSLTVINVNLKPVEGTHKDSGIVNDPNDWADEHDDPSYIFDLLRRIVTVSMRTNEIVAGLPKLKF